MGILQSRKSRDHSRDSSSSRAGRGSSSSRNGNHKKKSSLLTGIPEGAIANNILSVPSTGSNASAAGNGTSPSASSSDVTPSTNSIVSNALHTAASFANLGSRKTSTGPSGDVASKIVRANTFLSEITSGRQTPATSMKGRTESNLADMVKVALGDKDETQQRRQSIFQLSSSERAFLPREVQIRLGKRAGQLPPSPSAYPTQGAALFVDISGFTSLSEKLRAELSPEQAAASLAAQITEVLNALTKICLDYRGDVSKFAGDALLCVWDDSEGNALDFAKACSIEMLGEMKRHNENAGHTHLQIHGGVAAGSLLHFHLGSSDDELRIYLIAGAAVSAATDLVHDAGPGEIILCMKPVTALEPKLSMHSKMSFMSNNTSAVPGFEGITGDLTVLPPVFYEGAAKMKLSPAIGGRASIAFSPMGKSGSFRLHDGNNGTLRKRAPTGTAADLPAIDENEKNTYTTGVETRRDSQESRITPRKSALKRFSSNLQILVSEEEVKKAGALNINIPAETFNVEPSPKIPHPKLSPSHSVMGSSFFGETELLAHAEKADALIAASNDTQMILTADTDIDGSRYRGRLDTDSDPVLREGLARVGNVYIPKALRKGLRQGFKEGQIRNRVATMFVGLQDLVLSEQETKTNQVRDDKLDLLNSAFVGMTRIAHSFKGEIRDLLFDDKGCVFISVFGAHRDVERPDINAVKAAIAISNEIANASIGVSVGACFTGMCGTSKRHDFVVMGHEVNMAARYMSHAPAGTVYVSPEIKEATKNIFEYEEDVIYFGKDTSEPPISLQENGVPSPRSINEASMSPDGYKLKKHFVYKPNAAIAKRPSFVAQYIYGQRDKDLFVGRENELMLIETALAKNMGFSSESSSKAKERESKRRVSQNPVNKKSRPGTVILIESPPGMGKSTLVSRAKKLGKGRIKIVIGLSSDVKKLTKPFYAFSQVLESFTGLNPRMNQEEINNILLEYNEKIANSEEVKRVDVEALAYVLPWLDESKQKELNFGSQDIPKEIVQRITDAFMQIFRNGRCTNGFSAARGILVILEDIHFMDSYSLNVLEAILKKLTDLRGFVLMITIRTEDILKMNDILNGKLGEEDPDMQDEDEYYEKIVDLARYKTSMGLSLQLHGLSRGDVDRLVSRNLGVEELSRIQLDILDKIYDITDGYPLFVNHFVLWLTESDLIAKNIESGAIVWSEAKPITEVQFPATISETVRLRLDVMSLPLTKSVLQVAAIIGEDFTGKFIWNILRRWKSKEARKKPAEYDILKVLEALREAEQRTFVKHHKDATTEDSNHLWKWKHNKIMRAVARTLTVDETTKLQKWILSSRTDADEFQKALQSTYTEDGLEDDA